MNKQAFVRMAIGAYSAWLVAMWIAYAFKATALFWIFAALSVLGAVTAFVVQRGLDR